MSGRVFLDSGIFIAVLVRNDRFHPSAVELFGRIGTRWTTSLLVLSESYSWFLHRHGEEAARTLRSFAGSLKNLKLLEATLEHHDRTLRALDRYRGTKLTYVDAASLAWIDHLKIETVWSTDHHLSLGGAVVLPRT